MQTGSHLVVAGRMSLVLVRILLRLLIIAITLTMLTLTVIRTMRKEITFKGSIRVEKGSFTPKGER